MGGLQEEKDVWGWTKYGDEIVATKRERYWYEDKWVTDYMNTKTKKNTDENDFRAGSFCCTEDLRCPTDPDHVRYKAMGSGRKWWEVSHTPVQLYRLEPELKEKIYRAWPFSNISRQVSRSTILSEKDPSRPVSDANSSKNTQRINCVPSWKRTARIVVSYIRPRHLWQCGVDSRGLL